jgi:hypothetical protein
MKPLKERPVSRAMPAVWTHRMLAFCRTALVCQNVDIVRKGPPEAGKLFFDQDGYLIFIEDGFYTDPENGRLSNHFSWRRVLVTGQLSKRRFNGYWDWGNYDDSKRKVSRS